MSSLATPTRSRLLPIGGRPFDFLRQAQGGIFQFNGPPIAEDQLLAEIPPKPGNFDPVVIMFMGRRGHGKSLTMSILAYIMMLRYERWGVPFGIAANYQLDEEYFPGAIVDPFLVEAMLQFPVWCQRKLALFDEGQGIALSRRAMSKGNVEFSNFLTQMRKRDIEILFTTQFPQVMDYQILLQVDWFVETEYNPQSDSVTLYAHDWWGQWTGKNFRKPWPPYRHDADKVIPLNNVSQMFGHFNTRQLQPSSYIDPDRRMRVVDQEWDGGRLVRRAVEDIEADEEREERLAEAMESAQEENDKRIAEMRRKPSDIAEVALKYFTESLGDEPKNVSGIANAARSAGLKIPTATGEVAKILEASGFTISKSPKGAWLVEAPK